MKHILYYTKPYHKNYIGGLFASFAVIKTFVLFAGFFGVSLFGNTFAAGNELNSANITQAPYNCSISNTYCDLSWQNIDSIASGTFINHPALQTLDLDGNYIASIEVNTFAGLSSLKTLYLYDNQITTIESSTFNGLSSLEKLYLYSNEITTIESGAFAGLSSLTYLDLYSNEITTIESGAFAGLSSLDYLDLGRNLITSIQNNYFHELPLLTVLFLSQNTITDIVSDGFIGLSSLELLDLSSNQITNIENGFFDQLSLLKTLNLGDNQINNIESGAFDDLSSLTYLRLGQNKITNIVSDDFIGFSSLEILDLSSNQITNIESGFFDQLSLLKTLNLGDNQINNIESGTFAGLSSLIHLGLGQNKITTITNNTFGGLGLVKDLDLSSNQLLSVESDWFSGLSSLDYLYLYYNCIDPDLLSQDTIDFLNTPGFGWDSQFVCLDINYIPNTTTSGNVIGTLVFTGGLSGNRELLTIDNSILPFHIWTGNGLYAFDLTALNDDNYLLRANSQNQAEMTGEVTWIIDTIDTTAPIATISYSTTETTPNPVTATIQLNESGTITNNSGTTNYIFNNNGSFVFEFSDLSGNTGTAIATVFWISIPTTGNTTPGSATPGGNGGSTSLHKDDCPNGDYSYSYYDGICGSNTNNTGTTSHGSASCDITNSPYSSELTQAFSYAYSLGITTQCPINKAHLSDEIIRSNFAKMISEFAIKTLKKQPNTKLACSFADTANESTELNFYIKTACQLGLMGRNSDGKTTQKNFNPRDKMTRAQIGTVISRLLYEQQNNTSDSVHWFTKHLQALKIGGIMNDISKPYTKELRGYIMLMLYRITK